MMKSLQRLGRSLMLPVAVMPAAAILMGIGYAIDHQGWGGENAFAAFLITAGAAIIDNIPLLFAVGIAFGLSKDQNGAAGLAGLVAFLTVTSLLSPGAVANIGFLGELSDIQRAAFGRVNNAFIGILSGVIASYVYNRFHKTELPSFLAFFSGRRSVPIIVSGIMCAVAIVLMFIWPLLFGGLVAFGEFIAGLGAFGAGLYGFFNRLLIPIGLHHALNAVFWFDLVGINDLGNWFGAGEGVVGTTGMYMAGFFPVMMFGLPGACLAMWRMAKDKNKKIVLGLMMAAAFTSFFTGVTEPVEFAFMFVAPLLYVVHAVLTGISMIITASFSWFAGFGFSAGAIDFILSIFNPHSMNWWMLLLLGVAYFFVYFFVFTGLIKVFDLKTPGREEDTEEADADAVLETGDYGAVAKTVIEGLGGKSNVVSHEYCATRIRAEVKDYLLVDEKVIKSAGIAGVVRPSKTSVQVIVGTKVQFVADAMDEQLK
ncbi:MAG: N-acetylglucosamine-specific PTS transporter subunit IIBC [Oscillospiraceae bacterium]|nr:N-acetylglucosamine-specific PTS transporter subunit IIBC [Oscillospiraceae bacterium]